MKQVRIGVLGCAGVVRYALMDVVNAVPEATVAAIASRSLDKARAFAAEYGISAHYGSYEELLADPSLHLIYNPLPNSLHCEWSIRALEAGKAVLCEKPIAANSAQARQMLVAAHATGRPLIEAFHNRYHPVAHRIQEIVASGRLGTLRRIDTRFKVPASFVTPNNIRFQYELAGGTAMDPGCYCINLMRMIVGEEPRVTRATARLIAPHVDIGMDAELLFPSGCQGRFEVALDDAGSALDSWLKVSGDRGELEVMNPYIPHEDHSISLRCDGVTAVERLDRTRSYLLQLREVVRVVLDGLPVRTSIEDGVRNMKVIDDVYRAAGLPLRGE
jgi:predicted dehydrogenase